MADEVLTERRDRVLLITLNRPKANDRGFLRSYGGGILEASGATDSRHLCQ
jgi:enoyl-CoA hydratase/carnithine racemase